MRAAKAIDCPLCDGRGGRYVGRFYIWIPCGRCKGVGTIAVREISREDYEATLRAYGLLVDELGKEKA